MARYSAAFVWVALAYFTVGILMGAAMAVDPRLTGTLRVAHVHINLLGWVSMFIYGVAYHVLPRFTGQPLHSPRLAELHVVLANVGLVGLAVAFAAQGAPGRRSDIPDEQIMRSGAGMPAPRRGLAAVEQVRDRQSRDAEREQAQE